jgi:hypothetical protein
MCDREVRDQTNAELCTNLERESIRMTVYLETRKYSHWYSLAESVAETAAIGSVELPGLTVNTFL